MIYVNFNDEGIIIGFTKEERYMADGVLSVPDNARSIDDELAEYIKNSHKKYRIIDTDKQLSLENIEKVEETIEKSASDKERIAELEEQVALLTDCILEMSKELYN